MTHTLSKQERMNSQVTVRLLMATSIFFVTNIPWSLWETVDPGGHSPVRELVYNVINALLYMNPALNFYVYTLGCSRFRHDVTALFRCRKQPTRENTTNGRIKTISAQV